MINKIVKQICTFSVIYKWLYFFNFIISYFLHFHKYKIKILYLMTFYISKLYRLNLFYKKNYHKLLFEDIKRTTYLKIIFLFLKLPASNFIIKRTNNKIMVYSNIHITYNYLHFYKYIKNIFFKRSQEKKLCIKKFLNL